MGVCCGCGYERRTNPVRVLVLGLASCGKSTFLRQLQIKNECFTLTQQQTLKEVAYLNLLVGIKELVRNAHEMDLTLAEENVKRARLLSEINEPDVVYDDEMFQRIINVWNDPAIQQCWNQRHTFPMQILHMPYLVQNIERIRSPDFIPTKEDCVYLRQRTTGTVRVNFMSNKFLWEFVDVGGQDSERAKWECIVNNEKLDAVVFIASVDEFALYYNNKKDRAQKLTNLQIAMQVFGEVMNTNSLKMVPKVLFLNKLDLFKQRLNLESGWDDFQRVFPDYHNNNNNLREALDYIIHKFKEEYTPLKLESVRCGTCLDSNFVNDIFEIICQTYVDAALMASLNS